MTSFFAGSGRMGLIGAVASIGGLAFSPIASGQEACPRYVGQLISPITFTSAIAPFARLAPKTEFESTVDYEARLIKTLGPASTTPLIITRVIENRTFIEYNADTRSLRIYPGAFGHGFDAWDAFISTPYWNALNPDANNNVAVVISDPDVLVSSTVGSNAFGVRRTIKNYRRVSQAIFDHSGGALFPSSPEAIGYAIGEIPMSPEQARALEPAISLAFVVVPKAPFLITGSRYAASPTLEVPKRVKEEFSVLIGDIQCALVLDGNRKVLAAFATN